MSYVEPHRKPEGLRDRIAFAFVKFLRFFADLFFRKRYGHRAVVLETVAARETQNCRATECATCLGLAALVEPIGYKMDRIAIRIVERVNRVRFRHAERCSIRLLKQIITHLRRRWNTGVAQRFTSAWRASPAFKIDQIDDRVSGLIVRQQQWRFRRVQILRSK
ncbi:MAG: alternative oxidase, partial [Pseudomonadota bacterium]